MASRRRINAELDNLQKLYELIEWLHEQDPHPILSMYKACTVDRCSGLTLVDLARRPGVQIFRIEDRGALKPELGQGPAVGVLMEGCCDFYMLFKGEASFGAS